MHFKYGYVKKGLKTECRRIQSCEIISFGAREPTMIGNRRFRWFRVEIVILFIVDGCGALRHIVTATVQQSGRRVYVVDKTMDLPTKCVILTS